MSWKVAVFAIASLLATPILAQQVDQSGLPMMSQSISVDEAVGIALKNSPTVAARRAALAVASARVGMARAMTRPTVSASVFGTASSMPMIVPGPSDVQPQNFTLTPDKSRLDQNFMAMYPLYTGGRLKGQVNSAEALRDASSSDAASSELDVALAVKSAYRQAQLANRFVEAYYSRVDEAVERVRIAREAYDAGRIAKYDLLRNQTELADAQQTLNNAERDAETMLIDLRMVMGVSQKSDLTLSRELAFEKVEHNLTNLLSKALNQRPEVAAARARVRSAEATLGAAKGAYKPQVYATAMTDLSVMHDDGSDKGYLVGIAAALPALDGGLRKSAVGEARAMIDQMKAEERDAVLAVNRDVAAAVAESNTAAKNVTLSEAAVAQAEEDYRVVRMRYEAGKATNVEVLDALASLTRARTNHAEALYSHNIARDRLARAIGQR